MTVISAYVDLLIGEEVRGTPRIPNEYCIISWPVVLEAYDGDAIEDDQMEHEEGKDYETDDDNHNYGPNKDDD